ncbi:unnamed protein product [Sphenostylis stenocarpa]|uniref:Uncharacterized protein n=1 Tax=Sphenostylis stenocarpa TaxID=92480 RepID=A0AA86SWN4_9FABA|nr:unnamed protein product [Sphenostylis stenocarpa]
MRWRSVWAADANHDGSRLVVAVPLDEEISSAVMVGSGEMGLLSGDSGGRLVRRLGGDWVRVRSRPLLGLGGTAEVRRFGWVRSSGEGRRPAAEIAEVLRLGMKNKLVRRIKKPLSCSGQWHATECSSSPNHQPCVDVREEYANAFRTESYTEFLTRVLAYSKNDSSSCLSRESTTSARLPSYRLFAEHLLDPDQPTVTRALSLAHCRPKVHSLLSDYFSHTANSSLLFSHLLKDIDLVRLKYTALKTILQCVPTNQIPSPMVITHLTEFSNFSNSFTSSGQVRAKQYQCFNLQKRLESSRDKAQAKLQLAAKMKCGSACLVAAITASLVVITISHGLALIMAMPGLASMNLGSKRKLAKVAARLDAAAKGSYIVNKDLEMTSRLVARLNDELEYMRRRVKIWVERRENRVEGNDVVQLLKKKHCSFSEQLDELEEHLYLCFMTINRARDLVLSQISD